MRKSLIPKAIDNDKKAENVQNVLRFLFSQREAYRLQSRDNFNFYQHTLGQVCYANTASCRLCIAHGFGVHFIECTEIPCYVLEEASLLTTLSKLVLRLPERLSGLP